jgi:hypothetical protein
MFMTANKKSRTLGNKNHRLRLGMENLWKIYRLANGFCFFVTSTSGNVFYALSFIYLHSMYVINIQDTKNCLVNSIDSSHS